jgi:hypothetical protein
MDGGLDHTEGKSMFPNLGNSGVGSQRKQMIIPEILEKSFMIHDHTEFLCWSRNSGPVFLNRSKGYARFRNTGQGVLEHNEGKCTLQKSWKLWCWITT